MFTNHDQKWDNSGNRPSSTRKNDIENSLHDEETITPNLGDLFDGYVTSITCNEIFGLRHNGLLNGQHLLSRLLHDIWYPRRHGTFRELCADVHRRLSRFTQPTGLLFVFKHENEYSPHVHCVHDCTYSNRSCRCYTISDLSNQYRRRGRKCIRRVIRRGSSSTTAAYLENLQRYATLEQRLRMYFSLGGFGWHSSNTDEDNALCSSQETRARETLPDDDSLLRICDQPSHTTTNLPSTSGLVQVGRVACQKWQKSRSEYRTEQIL